MKQFPSQPDPQNPLKSHQTPPYTTYHPKIKPLLRRFYRENQLNETNYQRSLKMNSNTFRAVNTNTNKSRGPSSHYIKGYAKDLKAQNSLSKLSYSFNSSLVFENAYLFSKIRGLRNLTSLDVQFFINRRPIPLKVLFKSLAYLKDLTHFKLELNFYGFTDTDGQTLQVLFQSLQRLEKLKSLSLCFLMCSNFKKAKMNNLPQYLRHLKQLQSLELSFDRSRELTDRDMISLVSVFPKLPLLTQISLDFGGQRRIIEGSTLIQMFQYIRNLSGIAFGLGSSEVMKTESTDPLSEGLRLLHAPSLKKLNLHLSQNLDTQSFIELTQTIKRFSSLNILQLSLFGCETLTNDGAVELGSALSCLTMLSSFNLRVHHSIEADSVVGCIASGLKSSHNLLNLKLNFANIKTDPDQIQQLSASLANLNSLKFLDLSFSSVQSLSTDVLQKLGESLLELGQLKHLVLDFGYAKTVTNQGVEAITNAIQELHDLSFLDLNFVANEEIDEKAVDKIAETLRHLPSLYTSQIRFSRCPKLQQKERSFSSLFNALREMKNIREVFLAVSFNEINEQEVNDLKKRKTVTAHWF